MKTFILTSFLFLLVSFLNAQNNEQELLAKHNIVQRVIRGFEYDKDSLVKQSHLVEDFDEHGNTISFKTYDMNDSLVRQTRYKFSEDGLTEYGTMLDEDGKLKYEMIMIKNNMQRSVRKMQIDSKGDTLVEQIWIRDRNWNDSILFNIKNNKRIPYLKWTYNAGSMLVAQEKFDARGNLQKKDIYSYEKVGKCMIRRDENVNVVRHTCQDGNRKIEKILISRDGYRSGIKLVSEKGGERIETTNDYGLLDTIEYYSKEGKLNARIEHTYRQ